MDRRFLRVLVFEDRLLTPALLVQPPRAGWNGRSGRSCTDTIPRSKRGRLAVADGPRCAFAPTELRRDAASNLEGRKWSPCQELHLELDLRTVA